MPGSSHRLVFDVASEFVVELQLFAVEIERCRADFTLRKQLADFPGVRMRERDEGFLGAPQIKGSFVLPNGTLQTLDAAVNVGVEQREESSEVIGVALVRRGGHQQVVVRHLGKRFTQPIGVGLSIIRRSTHLVSFIDDDQIPPRPQQTFTSVLNDRHPRDGRDELIAFLPRILTVVGTQDVASNDLELLSKLVGQFTLPLNRQVRRCDDQHSLHQPACLEFLQQKPSHDCLAGSRIVGQQKPDAREFQKVAVDRFKLVRQRIDASNRKRKERVVLVGQSQSMSLDPQPKQASVTVERFPVSRDRKLRQLA